MGIIVILQIKKLICYDMDIGIHCILISYLINIGKQKMSPLLYHKYRKIVYSFILLIFYSN